MRTYLFLFFISFIGSSLFTPVVRALAIRIGMVDHPNSDRRIHTQSKPRAGGLAIFAAASLALLSAPFIPTIVGAGFSNSFPTLLAILAPTLLIFLLGIWDDLASLAAPTKFFVQAIAAILVYLADLRISAISLPFDGHWILPHWLSLPVTILWILLVTNAFNLIDGIDGLAAGASSFALLALFINAVMNGNVFAALLSVTLLGATLGFLPYNFNPATIFLGDSGSLLLGFSAAVLSLLTAQKSATMLAIATPIIAFGLPITEIALSLVRRYLSGAPLFTGDRGHIHHKLLDRGLSQREVALLLYGVCACLTFLATLLLTSHKSINLLVLFIICVGLTAGVRRLEYEEINEFSSRLLKDMWRHPSLLRSRIQLRQQFRALSEAKTMDDILEKLAQLFSLSGFAKVQLELFEKRGFHSLKANKHFQRSNPLNSLASSWSWSFDESDASHNEKWVLRLPLTNQSNELIGALTVCGLHSKMNLDPQEIFLAELMHQEVSHAINSLKPATDSLLQVSADAGAELTALEA